MNVQVRSCSRRNDAVHIGFRDSRKLKTERPIVSNSEEGIFKYDEGRLVKRPPGGCIVMAPPHMITAAEIDELGRRLCSALDPSLADQPKG